jgi:type I restriction enzyme, R subunit
MAQFPSFLEDHISQLPALQLLQSLGYVYLRPEEVILERRGNRAHVLLEGILEKQLRRLNHISFKGQVHEFSDRNIQVAIQTLKDIPIDGLVHSNEKVYDLLSLGKSLEQTIGGDTRSFTLNYIDWANPENNQFHVAEDFEVERNGSHQICRPDIVLFVNGIPFVVIECTRPDGKDALNPTISRQLRNQNNAYIPRIFLYSQLLLVANNNEAKYGTVGTRKEFWAKWKEENTNELGRFLNKPLSREQKERLFAGRFAYLREFFDELELEERAANQQDRAIYGLCRPARLIELARQFVVYDGGEKKIARYHQYLAIKNALISIKRVGAGGSRMGGVIWQTQGSGKSLAMVMLAKAIALDNTIIDARIVLVSDRIDLGDQIWGTFRSCGKEPVQAKTGRQLLELLARKRDTIITTLSDKFETALKSPGQKNLATNIFVLEDEKHRGQFGELNLKLQKLLPNACYISFIGAPLKKKDKATAARFGGIIDSYPVSQAMEDEVVVPLLYERRQILQILQDADRKIYLTALDISEHFSENWQGTSYKAQLLADSKLSALAFKKYLDGIGKVSSEVLLSDPDTREGDDAFDVREVEVGEEEIRTFWNRAIEKYGGEQEYNRSLINGFKIGEKPEIIIVVDKLLAGFDAPRNTVLYIARSLKGHSLLKAIARVNRLCEGKDFGYIIDYYGVLGDSPFSEFDQTDLQGMLTDISEEAAKLSERHAELWGLFNEIKNGRDGEAFERLLVDKEKRGDFYARLSAFSHTMSIAFSSVRFMEETREESLASYKRDLVYFHGLRQSVRRRYADGIDDCLDEARVQKLIEIPQIKPLVSIFEREKFRAEIDQFLSEAAKADTIAHRTKMAIAEKMEEDQIFYRRFSKSMDDAIKNWHEGRISDAEYLNKVTEIMKAVRDRTGGEIPVELLQNDLASAFYGIVDEVFGRWKDAFPNPKLVSVNAALRIERIIQENVVVDWITNRDVQNQIKNLIEDYLYSVKQIHDIDLRPDDMDRILDRSIEIAKSRYTHNNIFPLNDLQK